MGICAPPSYSGILIRYNSIWIFFENQKIEEYRTHWIFLAIFTDGWTRKTAKKIRKQLPKSKSVRFFSFDLYVLEILFKGSNSFLLKLLFYLRKEKGCMHSKKESKEDKDRLWNKDLRSFVSRSYQFRWLCDSYFFL